MSRDTMSEAVLDDVLTPKTKPAPERKTPLVRVRTKSSDSLRNMTAHYAKTNSELERSLDASEERYPTRAVVRERMLRIEQDIARTSKQR